MKKEYKLQFILTIIIIFLLVLLSQKLYFKIDTSKNKIYTLSKTTVELFNDIDDVVSITWFKSKDASKFFPGLNYLSDMLNEYANFENCEFKIINTETLNDNQIEQLKLIPEQIQTGNRDSQTIQNIYSSLMLEYKGLTKQIPFVFDVPNLEYFIANSITQLIQDSIEKTNDRHIYVLAPPNTLSGEYMYVLPFLEYAGFIPLIVDASNLTYDLNTAYPLLVIGSEYIPENAISKIDVFLKKNGNAGFFVSGVNVDTAGNWNAQIKNNDALIELLSSYGFFIANDLLVDIFNATLQMNATSGTGVQNINYPYWVRINKPQVNISYPFFAGYKTLQNYWASSIAVDTTLDNTLTHVVLTSKQSGRIIENFQTDPFLPQQDLFASLQKSENAVATVSTKNGRIFVMADELCISRMVDYTGSDYNMEFLVNVAEWLAKKDSLLTLKNKQSVILPFKSFESQTTYNTIKLVSRIINLVVIPILILVAMVMVRKTKK